MVTKPASVLVSDTPGTAANLTRESSSSSQALAAIASTGDEPRLQ